MKTRLLTIGLVMLGLVAGAAVVGKAAGEAIKGKPTAVAVADIETIFSRIREKSDLEADNKSRQDRLGQQEIDRRKEINQLQEDLKVLGANNPAYAEKEKQLRQKLYDLQFWGNYERQELVREVTIQKELLYRRITDAIGRVAKNNGFDLVLFKEKPADFRNAKPEQVDTLIQVRKVLWSADDLDLTEQVIQAMDNEYANNVKAAPATNK